MRIPPVVVRGIQVTEYLLTALGRQVSHPVQLRAGPGQVGALLHGPQPVPLVPAAAITRRLPRPRPPLRPHELALLQRHVP